MKEIFENLIVPKRILNGDAVERNTETGTNRRADNTLSVVEFPEAENDGMTRREFIKTLAAFLGGVAVFGLSACEKKDGRKEEFDVDHLPPDFWFNVMTNIYERFGEEPSPVQIRAHAIIRALGIPSGQVSALTSTPDAIRTAPQTDEVLAKRLTNDAGVEILPEHIASSDILDLYPKGLPEELKKQLDIKIEEMFEARYAHAQDVYRKCGETNDEKIVLDPEHYFRLPGGIDLLMVGYAHTEKYQEIHGNYLEFLSQRAAVIAVEGFIDHKYGTSLQERYMENVPFFGYDTLMRRAKGAGFRGLFAEVNARDRSKVNIDPMMPFSNIMYPILVSGEFRKNYLEYIRKENPALYEKIGSEENFEHILSQQLSAVPSNTKYHNARLFIESKMVDGNGAFSRSSQGFEFGQMMYSDALSAIKLLLIGKLMADGKIAKGPILDIQGAAHLSGKSFFIRYPEYAMEVVLRNLPELMAFRAENGISDLEKELEHPDWSEVVRQVAKLAFARTHDFVETAGDTDRIETFSGDFLGEYGIDPEKVIPSNEEIQEIMEKTKRGAAVRKRSD